MSSSPDLPEWAVLWSNEDNTLEMIDTCPNYFMAHVSTATKDAAKEKGLAFFDYDGPSIVLTDDPKKYGLFLQMFGLESYLQKRIGGVI